jgi:outer membrane receptor protein involved in Fe transport
VREVSPRAIVNVRHFTGIESKGDRMRFNSRGKRLLIAAAVCIGVPFLVQAAGAQTIDEIVVTASKRGEVAIQDVPVSVQVVDGGDLQEAGDIDFMDYFYQVPGLSINNQGPGDKQYIIRGIQSSGAGTVGLYFDEVIITGENEGDGGKQPDIKMFDIDRIEVLKGPQGTTFGSSSLSGTIRWLPNAPQYDSLELDLGGGFRLLQDSSDFGWQTDGMINVPVIEDKLAVRLAGFYHDKAGYLDNKFEEDANHEQSGAARAMISWRATEELEISTMAMIQSMDVGARNFFNDTTALLPLSDTLNGQDLPGDYYQAVLTGAGFEDDLNIYNVKAIYDKPWGTITGTHSVFSRHTFARRATSFASEVLFGLPADENPAFLGNEKDRDVVSSEIRFASTWDSAFQLLVGGFLQKEDRVDITTYVFTDPASGKVTETSELGARRDNTAEISEIAAFGEISWDLTDQLTLTAGGRWFDLETDAQDNVIILYIFQPGVGLLPPRSFDFSDVILKGNLAWKLTDEFMVFAQVAEGYRAGGANDQSPMEITDVIIPPGFESDSLVNYEIGVKSSYWNDRLTVNGSLYFIDWSNIQVEQQATNSQGLSFSYRGNGGGAEVKGIELEVNAMPTDRLNVGASLSYLQAELTEDFPIPSDGLEGDEIPHSPELSGSVNARYEYPLPNELTGFIGGDWSYRGESANQFRPDAPFYRSHDSYSLMNLRGGIVGEDWSLVLALDNALDADEIISYTFDFQFPPIPGERFLPDNKVRPWPRTFSVMLRKQFY